jgi:uncharacterized sulfatase
MALNGADSKAQPTKMNRRSFVKTLGATGAAVTGAGQVRRANGAARRQAILLITDSVRADMLNCYRQTGLKTPNLDQLAADGIRFEHAYTCQPVCTPARSALFTGTYPHSNGAWANSLPLGQTVHTVGQRLHDHDIRAAYIGKWHLDGSDYFGIGRAAAGWDAAYWYDQRDYLAELSPADRVRSRKPTTNNDPDITAEFTFAHRCSNRAIDFLEKHANEDFLLVVSYDEPHDPGISPRPYSEMYKDFIFPSDPDVLDDLKGKPEEQRIWAGEALERPPGPIRRPWFFGALSFVDSEIGRVMNAIDRYAPDSLVMYTADHGDFLEAHRLNGGKGACMYEEITRVPFLVRWRGQSPKNSVCAHPISHIDLSGTLMEFYGYSVPKSFEGGSMLATFKDPKVQARDEVFIEFGRYEVDHDGFGGFQPIRCIFDGRFKLAVNLMTTDELYDLETDRFEIHNLIDSPDHAATRNGLHDKLLDWMNRTRDPFRGYYWGRRPWRPDFPVSWANAGMTRQREDDGYEPRQLNYATGLTMKNATRPK